MQALRERFKPPPPAGQPFPGSDPHSESRVNSRDYFAYVLTSPTVKAPSLPSTTPRNAMTPAAGIGHFTTGFNFTSVDSGRPHETEASKKSPDTDSMPEVGPSTATIVSPDSTTRRSSQVFRRASSVRKQVAAGDLAMSNSASTDENGGAYYRPSQTPGLSRMDTWRGRFSGSTIDLQDQGGMPIATSPNELDNTFELREAVLLSIAKSIGLAQPVDGNIDPLGRASVAPSVSAASTPNSPMFVPGGRTASRSPFGNILDMMNASSNVDNILGGMLRDAAIHAQADDDEASSVTGSMQDSQAGAGSAPNDFSNNVLRDLEKHVEILFHAEGDVLVKEGERSPGLYYVIDGFLEVRGRSIRQLTNRFLCLFTDLQTRI